MNKSVTILVSAVICALIITIASIVVKKNNDQPKKNKHQKRATVEPDIKSNLVSNSKEIPISLYDFLDTYKDGMDEFYSQKIYWDDFKIMIAKSDRIPSARKNKALKFFKETMFVDEAGHTITNFLEFVLQKRIEYDYLVTGKYYSAAFISLRYKNLIPYIKLVERERLRVRFDTVEEYDEFFSSDEVNKLFQELIVDKLEMSQIMAFLREKPLSTGEISEILGKDPSEVAIHLNSSVRQGLVRFDESQKRFVAELD